MHLPSRAARWSINMLLFLCVARSVTSELLLSPQTSAGQFAYTLHGTAWPYSPLPSLSVGSIPPPPSLSNRGLKVVKLSHSIHMRLLGGNFVSRPVDLSLMLSWHIQATERLWCLMRFKRPKPLSTSDKSRPTHTQVNAPAQPWFTTAGRNVVASCLWM